MRSPYQPTTLISHRRGVATVEVALTVPVLFLVLLLGVEATRLNTLRNTMENAVYEGARRGIVPGASVDDVEAKAEAILNSARAHGFTITTEPSVITDATHTLTVTIDVPLSANSWIGKPMSQHMVRSCTLSRERID